MLAWDSLVESAELDAWSSRRCFRGELLGRGPGDVSSRRFGAPRLPILMWDGRLPSAGPWGGAGAVVAGAGSAPLLAREK